MPMRDPLSFTDVKRGSGQCCENPYKINGREECAVAEGPEASRKPLAGRDRRTAPTTAFPPVGAAGLAVRRTMYRC